MLSRMHGFVTSTLQSLAQPSKRPYSLTKLARGYLRLINPITNIPTLPTNFVVLSYSNDGLTSIKYFLGKNTKTYGSNFAATCQINWQI